MSSQASQERLFIALHPFLTIAGHSPDRSALGPFTVLPNGKVLGQAPAEFRKRPLDIRSPPSRSARERYEVVIRLMKTAALPVEWEDVRAGCGFSSLADVQNALYAISATAPHDAQSIAALNRLMSFCDGKRVFIPFDGVIPPSLERAVGSVLERLGASEVVVSDELGIHEQSVNVVLLTGPEPLAKELMYNSEVGYSREIAEIATKDGRFVCRSTEGLFYSIMHVRDREIQPMLSNLFEGFWCDSKFAEDWWLPKNKDASQGTSH